MASRNTTSLGERMAQLSLASDNGVGDLLPSAGALLKVLSYLNADEVQEEIVFVGMRSVALPNFPATTRSYLDARAALVNAGMVTHTISSRTLKIKTYARARAMQDMSNGKKQSRLAFDAAVVLLSAGWPFLTTQNVNSVTRLRTVRKFMPHVVALRSACMDLEAAEVVPDMRFCALLQEEAWLEMLQTNIRDMHLECYSHCLPMAHRIIRYHQLAFRDPILKDEYSKLLMNQARLQGIAASLLGQEQEAFGFLRMWVNTLRARFNTLGEREDERMLAFVYNETGMQEMRKTIDDSQRALQSFELARETVDRLKGPRDLVFDFALPIVNEALMYAHHRNDFETAERILTPLLGENCQVDDETSLETGIILFAMGTVKAYIGKRNIFKSKIALGLLKRAVAVLVNTHGETALFTLAATYRLAATLYEQDEYDEAIVHLDKINLAFMDYRRSFDSVRGADILLQKGRALWKSGRALLALGEEHMELEAQEMLDESKQIHWDVTGRVGGDSDVIEDRWDCLIYHLYR